MSYASRLVEMSRGAVPVVGRSAGAGDETVAREEHVETVPPAATTAAPSVTPSAAPKRSSLVIGEAAEAIPVRERTEHTIVERVREVPAPFTPEASILATTPQVVAAPESERIVLPAQQPPWLDENLEAPDPLVASADTDALRDLMRTVRQWTSSAPTIVETPVADRAEVVDAPAAPPPEPVQVSIGNVVITVEDAPAASLHGRAAVTSRVATDRLARNHIRGS